MDSVHSHLSAKALLRFIKNSENSQSQAINYSKSGDFNKGITADLAAFSEFQAELFGD